MERKKNIHKLEDNNLFAYVEKILKQNLNLFQIT